jgi:membrane fusion protein, multidrug efflux system
MRYWLRSPGRTLALGIAVVGVGCKSAAPPRKQPATPVRVARATLIDAPVNLLASGIVEPKQTVAVTTQVSGSLMDVLFNEGDFVRAGQVLFRIDPRPLEAALDQARATLARDVAQAAAGARDDERYHKLADMGYVSRSQADQMHATALAQAATVRADEAAVRSAEVNYGFTTIRAPIAGRTGSLLVRKGNNVSPGGGPLVVINQLSPVLVRFPVLEQDFDPLQSAVAAHPLRVTAVSSDSTQATEVGQLSFLDNAVDSLTGTVTGKAEFANPARRLWPGELVFLTVQLSVQHNVIAVPNEAILTGQQGSYVYVIDQKKLAQTRPVATSIDVGDMTVVPRGLVAGETVVIDGQSRLNPGSRVALITTGSDTGGAAQVGAAAPTTTGSAAGDVTTARAGAAGSASSADGGVGTSVVSGAPGATNNTTVRTVSPAPSTSTVGGAAPSAAAQTIRAPTTPTPTTRAPTTTTPATVAPTTRPPTGGRPPNPESR